MTDSQTTELPHWVKPLWQAWMELNAIRARDGVAYHKLDGMPYCNEEYFSSVVDDCKEALGKYCQPWEPKP